MDERHNQGHIHPEGYTWGSDLRRSDPLCIMVAPGLCMRLATEVSNFWHEKKGERAKQFPFTHTLLKFPCQRQNRRLR